MRPFLVKEIRTIVNGRLYKGSDAFQIFDATYHIHRMKKTNMLFFPRTIKNIDWNILTNTSPCAIITDTVFPDLESMELCTIILVENTEDAYWKFVEYYRGLWEIPVVAVTGTSGKSTTKDMIKHILKANYKVHGTKGSVNSRTNHFSYLLGIDESTEIAVFEAAIGQPGDITNACKYFKPNIGIITNIGAAHLDLCKTKQAYIKAKAEMVSAISDNGILIINSDDENSKTIGLDKYRNRKIYFGIDNPSEFQGSNIEYANNGMKFKLTFNNLDHNIFVPGYGRHQVYNALAALAAVHELGVEIEEAAVQLETFKNLRLHMELTNGINGSLIIDDTWNLTPSSLIAAFETLNVISQGKKRVALIGEIQRLGEESVEILNQITDMMVEQEVDILIAFGSTSEIISKQLKEKGSKTKVYSFPKPENALELTKSTLDKNTILLTKCHMHDHIFKEFIKNFKITMD